MKIKTYLSIFAMIALIFNSCKKDEASNDPSSNDPSLTDAKQSTNRVVNSLLPPRSVVTIAGTPYDPKWGQNAHSNDGIGAAAGFFTPEGICIRDDGTLYVADRENHKIRKITTESVVTTVPIPLSDGESIYYPYKLDFSANGTLNIITFPNSGAKRIWILKPDGTVSTPPLRDYPNELSQNLYDLCKDPYGDFFWFLRADKLEKLLPGQDGKVGTNSYSPPLDSLKDRNRQMGSLFCARNGVKYFGSGAFFYQLTPGGTFTRIFRTIRLRTDALISDLVATNDSRTIYFAESGYIKSIFNNHLEVLAGPNAAHPDGRDGVGSAADVYARSLVLSKDENTIYFTDQHNTIRKLILK